MKPEDRYDSLFRYYAELAGLGNDWLRFKAQVGAESNFDPDAVSAVGAQGLAQFMPATWKEWWDGTPGIQDIRSMVKHINPKDPEDAIFAQVTYMKWLLSRLDWNWDRAWAAYNWGIGNLLRVVAANPDGAWAHKLPLETKAYLKHIHDFLARFEREAAGG